MFNEVTTGASNFVGRIHEHQVLVFMDAEASVDCSIFNSEVTMTIKKKEWVLSNGNTFLAISAGTYGGWAKAADPITAIRDAYKASGEKKEAICVFYGDSETLHCGSMGGYDWDLCHPPTPIGMFLVTNSSIRPMKKGAFNDEHDDHLEWMEKVGQHIEAQAKQWAEKRELESEMTQ